MKGYMVLSVREIKALLKEAEDMSKVKYGEVRSHSTIVKDTRIGEDRFKGQVNFL